ncbi:unnamed protein product, partial [Rotaria socialis]
QQAPPQPPIIKRNDQIISETMPKKTVNTRPRAALFFTTTRNLDQSSDQHEPLLPNETYTAGRHDSIDSHNSMDNDTNNWSVAPRIMTPAARTVPIHTLSPIINTIQPRPQ